MRWLLGNWHLKLAAVAVATVLYTGLVFSGTFSDSSIRVRIQQTNVSRDAFVLSGDLGFVEIRYRVANDAGPLSESDFVARVDMSQYDMDRAPEPQQLPIEVIALRDGVQILSPTSPDEVRVEMDQIETRTVSVEVDPGDIPEGLEIDDPVVSVSEVAVRGPSSFVNRVDRAVAFVNIPASGINVNEAVDLVAVDIAGQPVAAGMVELDPETVSVQVEVSAIETQTTVAVRPIVEPGTPAPGFALASLRVDPPTVTIVGLPEDLAEIGSLVTEPINIDGLSDSQTFEVALQLPEGIALAPGEDEAVSVEATIVPSVSSRTFIVGIECTGEGGNACLPDFDQMEVTVSGSGEALGALTADDVTPVVDVSGLGPGEYALTPTLPDLPAGIDLLDISPGSVRVSVVAPAPPETPAPTP